MNFELDASNIIIQQSLKAQVDVVYITLPYRLNYHTLAVTLAMLLCE